VSTRTWRSSWTALVMTSAARLVLGVLLLLLAVSVVPRLAGWETSVVMSGSMSPAAEPGDVVVFRPATPEVGDVVLVDDPDLLGELRLHRVVAVEEGGLRLQGDANPTPDGALVAPAAVHGVGALRLPALGLPAVWAEQGRTGMLVLTGAAAVALLALARLHRPAGAEERRPSRRVRGRAVVPLALAVTGVVLVAHPGMSGALAAFTATTTNPTSTFRSTGGWTCAGVVQAAGAPLYLPLQDSAGPVVVNKGLLGASGNGTSSSSGVTHGVNGPRCGDGGSRAVRLDGASGQVWTTSAMTDPQDFSVQIWFSTTTTRGGKLIGFGNGTGGATSSQYDRHLYMSDDGRLTFGVYNSAYSVITSSSSYNDGRWHLATATLSSGSGMRLYVDGALVASNPGVRSAENFTGYWRIGYDNLGNWPNRPTSDWFAGSLAHAAGFAGVLTDAQVGGQYDVGPWSCAAAAGATGAGATQYWSLQEPGGPTAVSGGAAGTAGNGTYSGGGVTYRVPGPGCGPGLDSGVRLDGSTGQIWTGRQMVNPQWFSVQIWFSTTTTRGGKLIGFGASTNGTQSSKFDRHIYMTNSGALRFGVYNGGHFTVGTPGSYNDGRWHLATATFSPSTGMALYVDGALAGSSTATTAAENTTGYWRIGYDNLGSWPDNPASAFFAGSVAHASVYERVLTAEEVAGQYAAGG
jgi:signal peptidase I